MSTSQDFTCIFCSETFEDKETLQEHFRKHGDPKFNNIAKTKGRSQNEPYIGSEKSEESEMVGCDVCDEMFPSISKAITHKHKMHPDHDTKHFCPWCGKLFTMKHLYNKHMQSNHINMSKNEENIYHCDSCNVDLFVPSAMVYHNKFFHRQDTELPSIGHSKKVKTFNQEMIQIYYCPFCGEEYNNKVNLHKHMSDDHSDENQSPEEVLRCPLCDAVFYHLDAYELHLSFHSADDIYSDDSEMPPDITEFSLESVPPIMEKVEEEIKNTESEGIDKFLQLVMEESRESGNIDINDKPKSKKHKKHKKSKKAAITLDEFLNMNKDVFGDGLDVQGIEEIPTQQVLKKCKGKKDNTARPLPASAIAKLKKQGITVKSNSGKDSPILKASTNLAVNATKVVQNRIPVICQEKPKVSTSNELLSKLLNQGSNQIKIVKKSTAENLSKDSGDSQESSNISKSVTDNQTSQINDAEVTNGKHTEEMARVTSNDMGQEDNDDFFNDDEKLNKNVCSEDSISTTVDSSNINAKQLDDDFSHQSSEKFEQSKINVKSPNYLHKNPEAEENMTDKDDSFETCNSVQEQCNEDGNPNITEDKHNKIPESYTEENFNKRPGPINPLKHLSGVITIKPAHSAEDKSSIIGKGNGNQYREDEAIDDNITSNVTKRLGNSVQNVALKKSCFRKNKLASPTKCIETFKNLSKQLTITPCVSSTTHCDESEDDESDHNDPQDNIITPSINTINDNDSVNFKAPMTITKQKNTPDHTSGIKKLVQLKNIVKEETEEDNTKNSLNMDILKRLTNVTAKPIAKATTSVQVSKTSVQSSSSSPKSVIQHTVKVEKNRQIDQDIEIFNIDDSDSDQDPPDDETLPKQTVNNPASSDTKTLASVNVLKNLSKNITVKPTIGPNKNIFDVKKQIHSEISKPISDSNVRSPSNTDSKNNQNKQINFNVHLNHTLKKLGNNISIKSQYSSSDVPKNQIVPDENLENPDMSDDESDYETTNKVKIREVQEDEDLPSDADMDYNENVTVQSPQPSNSENEEETYNSHSEEETNEDIEKQIKTNTLSKENTASKSLDNFKRNNRQLTIKSLSDKTTIYPQAGSPINRKEETVKKEQPTKLSKEMCVKQFRDADEDQAVVTKNVNQSAATSSSSQKVTNQVNTVKTFKTFQSETIIEEITTTVTKTIRTVNQSSKQVAQNANSTAHRPRLMLTNHQGKPLQGMTVRNAQTVGTKLRHPIPSPRPTIAGPAKPTGQLVPVRPQNVVVPRQPGVLRHSAPGPSNIRKITPQSTVQKPVVGKPLRISPLAMNQTLKRAPEEAAGHFSCFKKPKESTVSSMNAFDESFSDFSTINYSSASSSRSDFSTTATKIVKGKSVVTATQSRTEQHSEHISKLNNMAGLKIVRTSAKQASQVETRQDIGTAKRNTLDAIERLQKQGLLIKKPRIEEPEPEQSEQFNSDSGEDDYYDE